MNKNKLKIIACIAMIIDHIALYFFEADELVFLRYIGRIAGPLYVFCLADGMKYTRDKAKYIFRLYVVYFIMMILGMFPVFSILEYHRMLLTLCLSAIMICLSEKKDKKMQFFFCLYHAIILFIVIAIKCLCDYYSFLLNDTVYTVVDIVLKLSGSFIITEGGFFFAILGVILYKNRESKKALLKSIIIFTLFYTLMCGIGYYIDQFTLYHIANAGFDTTVVSSILDTLCMFFTGQMPFEMTFEGKTSLALFPLMMLLSIPFIMLYNGEQGNEKYKKVFYYIYPMHLILISIILHMIKR